MEPSPCCHNCTKYGTLDLDGWPIGLCTVLHWTVKRRVAINGPRPCEGKYYKRRSVFRETVIEVIRKGYKREGKRNER